MPGRKYSQQNSSYRYGFNGKENDNDVKGEGNQQDYGERIYDTRLGKFLSVDPLTKDFPELTPYQFSSNSPIENIDLDGLEGISNFKQAQARKFEAATKLALAQPKPREIEIMVWNPYRGQAQIGKASVVMENISIARNNYNNAVASNIASSPFGAADYMLDPSGGGFKGAAFGDIMMSFGGITKGSSVLSRPQRLTVEPSIMNTEARPFEQKPITLTISLKKGWNSEQVGEAYDKAQLITTEGINTKVNRANTANRPPNLKQKFVANGGVLKKGQDVDHKQDLILNGNPGADGRTNLGGTNNSVNRSFGKQFEIQTRNVPDNTRVSGVYINPFNTPKK